MTFPEEWEREWLQWSKIVYYYSDGKKSSLSFSVCLFIDSHGTDTVEARRRLLDTCSAFSYRSLAVFYCWHSNYCRSCGWRFRDKILTLILLQLKRDTTSRMSRRKVTRRDYLLLISITITIFKSHTFLEFHFSLRALCEFEGHCLFTTGTFHPRSPLWITSVACPFRYLPTRSMGVRY